MSHGWHWVYIVCGEMRCDTSLSLRGEDCGLMLLYGWNGLSCTYMVHGAVRYDCGL